MERLQRFASAMILFAGGCEEPEDARELGAFEPGAEDDAGDVEIEPIKDGDAGGLAQTVTLQTDIGLCTGLLLNPSAVLTAAHCVAPLTSVTGGWVQVPALGADFHGIDTARIWVHDPHFYRDGTPPSAKYDVAIVGLEHPIEGLDTDLGGTLAVVSTERPEDGSGMWINGRTDNGTATDTIHHKAVQLDPLPVDDERYPFQLLDTIDSVLQGGDSGGPLFRERAGEDNDGQGGKIAPVVYGVNSRVGSFARLDPIKSWIDKRAADALRSHHPHDGDWEWAICDRAECPVYATNELDGYWEKIGTVPRDAKMGVFVQKGDTLVVSYPMKDRDRKVQVVNRWEFRSGGLGGHGAPPAEDLRIEDKYCQAAGCVVYAKRDLNDLDVTPIGIVGCGYHMGVFVRSQAWAVVSYPMDDRGRAVQVVPNVGDGWISSTPTCK